jgi:hypothetical protein
VADVFFGQIIVGQVQRFEAVLGSSCGDFGRLAARRVVKPTNTWALLASLMR